MRANASSRPARPIDCGERHFTIFFEQFRGALRILRGLGHVALLRRLRIEQENVRTAFDYALTTSGLGEKAVELAGAMSLGRRGCPMRSAPPVSKFACTTNSFPKGRRTLSGYGKPASTAGSSLPATTEFGTTNLRNEP